MAKQRRSLPGEGQNNSAWDLPLTQELEGLVDGVFDLRAMFAEAVDLLKSSGLPPVDRPCCGRKNTRFAAVRCELPQDRNKLLVKLRQAELRVPKT